MNLHTLEPDKFTLRYGELGRNGSLGFDELFVFVRGCPIKNVISAHPPSSLIYQLQDSVTSFNAMVALNDTSVEDVCATFKVFADDVLVAVAPSVFKSDGMIEISAEFSPANKLELVVETPKCEFCHAIWIDARVDNIASNAIWVESPIGGISVGVPRNRMHVDKCIAVVATENCMPALSDLIGSLHSNGHCNDCHVICFGVNLSQVSIHSLEMMNIMHIPCFIDPGAISPMFVKTIMYAIAQIVVADSYLLLDADMMCLAPLDDIWSGTRLQTSLLIVPDSGAQRNQSVWANMMSTGYPYFCNTNDIPPRWHCMASDTCMTVINGGLIAGNREAMLGLDTAVRRLQPEGYKWCNTSSDVLWREQALLNIAAAKVGIVELDTVYNVQLLHDKPQINSRVESVAAWLDGKRVHILHFNGEWGKIQYERDLKNRFALVPNIRFSHYGKEDGRLIFEGHAWVKHSSDHWRRSAERPWRRQFEISIHQLMYVADWCTERNPENIIDCGSSAGMLAFAARCGSPSGNAVICLDIDQEEIEALDKAMYCPPKRTWISKVGDLLVLIKNTNFANCDLLLLDTSRDDRTTATILGLAQPGLPQNARIIIADVGNPLCKMTELLARAKVLGFEVVNKDKNIDVLELKSTT